jgi:hypothetical protein
MAHMQALHSRAMATPPCVACVPLAMSALERLQRRTWACQRMAWLTWGILSRRRCRWRLTLAGSRSAQAPSTKARRAWLCPVLGMLPCCRRPPLAYAEGGSPRECLRWRGGSKRGRSPSAATVGTATVHGTPRRAWRASITGAKCQVCPCSWRARASRPSRAGLGVCL